MYPHVKWSSIGKNLIFVAFILFILYKSIIVVNEQVYNRFRVKARKAQNREIEAYNKLEDLSIKLNRAYKLIDQLYDEYEKKGIELKCSDSDSDSIKNSDSGHEPGHDSGHDPGNDSMSDKDTGHEENSILDTFIDTVTSII